MKLASLAFVLFAALQTIAADPDRPKKTISEVQYPERVFVNEKGNVCADFGKAAFGWLEISAPKENLKYFLSLGELLFPDGTVCRTPGRNVRAEGVAWHTEKEGFQRIPVAPDLRNSFSAKEGHPAKVRPEFGLVLPFRAVEIYRADFPVTKETIRRHVVSYPADRNESSFSCDDRQLVKVYDFCKHTMFATSFTGMFVDGDRERIPYEADAYASQLNWYAVSSDYAYPRASIEYLYHHPTWPTEFRQISVLSAWTDWMWTGNTKSLERNYELLKNEKLLTRFERESDGLIVSGGEKCRPQSCNRLGLADIVDWPVDERDGFDFRDVNAVVNAFHYRSLLAMADMAGALGKTEDAAEFKDKAAKLKKTYLQKFFNVKTGLFVDGEGSSHSSLHANVLPVVFGIAEGEKARWISDWLVMRGMACSVYFSQYLMEALFRTGHDEAAIALMTANDDRSWIGMMDWGATMTMEAWNMRVKPNMDWNHSWGATALNAISRFVCGVTPLKPGFAEISIAPKLGTLKKLKAEVPTRQGTVKINVEGNRLEVHTPASAVVEWCGKTVRAGKGKVVVEPEKAVKASSFGFDAQDSTEALQKAFDSGAKRVIVDRQAADWICRPLAITNSNLEIIFEDGVVVRARKGMFRGTNDRLLSLRDVSNVVLRAEGRAVLEMNKSDYLDPKQQYPRAIGGHRHGLGIYSSRNVKVENLTIRASGGDGVYVNKVRNLKLDNVVSELNLRQGISVISVSGLEARHCLFATTAGGPPQCGLDVEPNSDKETVENMLFDRCSFNANASNGIEFHLVHLKAHSTPLTAAFRSCVAIGNGRCGIKTCAGRGESAVGGKVVFEHCEFSGNKLRPVRLTSHRNGGLDFSFRRCSFDSTISSEKHAFLLDNSVYPYDFSGVEFDNCTFSVTNKQEVFGFAGLTGYGVTGLAGSVLENRDGYTREYYLNQFKERHRPNFDEQVRFRADDVDAATLKALGKPSAAPDKGTFTPLLRKAFTIVVAVPSPGEHAVDFRLTAIRRGGKAVKAVVMDAAGHTLGLNMLEGEGGTIKLAAKKAGNYLVEVDTGGYAVKVGCGNLPFGILNSGRIKPFRESGAKFLFAVPANAREVLVEVSPEEEVSACLVNASGETVATAPWGRIATIMKAERKPSEKDEVWSVVFPKVREDFSFRVGGDAVPVVSPSAETVLAR